MRVAASKEERKRDVVTSTEEGTDEGGRQQGRTRGLCKSSVPPGSSIGGTVSTQGMEYT